MKIPGIMKLFALLDKTFPNSTWKPLMTFRRAEFKPEEFDDPVRGVTNQTKEMFSKEFLKVAAPAFGGTALVIGGVPAAAVYRHEIKDLFQQALEEIEGTQQNAVNDQSNAGGSVSVELLENGPTIAVLASAHDDQLYGNSDSNWLAGKDGNDSLWGAGGDDMLDGGAGADVIDGGEGDDTADYSGSDAGVNVDLVSGEGRGGHAEGDRLSSIEHLVGSQYNDTLRGTEDGNVLSGSGGDDVLEGRGGDDVLIGGAGADVLDGGEGMDLADYSDSDAGVVIDLAGEVGSGGHAEGDQLFGIDHVIGSGHDDTLRGTEGSNLLAGGAGNDVLEGRGGDDVLIGGGGADLLEGGEGIDTVYYNASETGVIVDLSSGTGSGGEAEGDQLSGIESVFGSLHGDRLIGDGQSNLLSGLDGDDVLQGGAGDDYLIGGAGADVLDGGEGEDLVDYSASDAGVTVDLQSGQGSGGHAEGDQLSGVDRVLGSAFGDELRGDDGWDNLLAGLDGDDVLDGRGGNDTLIGGAGNDRLTGGAGEDTFVFKGEAIGHDVITDFEAGDLIELSAADQDFWDGYSVMQAAEQVGNDVLIRLDAERSITLENTQLSSLSHNDFYVAA